MATSGDTHLAVDSMTNRRRTLTVLASLALSVALTATPALASASPDRERPQEVVSALDSLKSTGRLSKAAKQILKRHPDIAASVVDPASAELVQDEKVAAEGEIGVQGCWITRYGVRYRTVLGATAFVFRQRVDYCANGSQVTSIHYRYGYLEETASFFYWRGLIANAAGRVPSSYVESFMQAHVENCVLKYGCITSNYPWVRTKLRGNNTSSADVG